MKGSRLITDVSSCFDISSGFWILEFIDTKSRDHKWPLPLEVIYEVVEELESRGLLDDSSDHHKTSRVENKSMTRFEVMSKQVQEEEAEHTPERGIISLKRFQQNRSEEES